MSECLVTSSSTAREMLRRTSVRRSLVTPGAVITALFATAVAGCGLSTKTVPAEWMLRAPAEGRVLELRVSIGVPCNELGSVDVEETAETVRVSTRVRRSSGECVDLADVEDVQVELNEPLADRELRGCAPDGEGAIGEGLPNPDCLRVDE